LIYSQAWKVQKALYEENRSILLSLIRFISLILTRLWCESTTVVFVTHL